MKAMMLMRSFVSQTKPVPRKVIKRKQLEVIKRKQLKVQRRAVKHSLLLKERMRKEPIPSQKQNPARKPKAKPLEETKGVRH